jgi:hypothetical protein
MSDGTLRVVLLGGSGTPTENPSSGSSVNPNYVAIVRGETPSYFETDDKGVFLLIQGTALGRLSGGVILADGEWYWTFSPLTEDAKTSVAILMGQLTGDDRDLKKFLTGLGQTGTASGPLGLTLGEANSGTQYAILIGFNSRAYDSTYSVGLSGKITRD